MTTERDLNILASKKYFCLLSVQEIVFTLQLQSRVLYELCKLVNYLIDIVYIYTTIKKFIVRRMS